MDRAIDVIHWNKKLMSALGLWPHQRNDLWFMINFVYFVSLAVLGYVDLFLFIGDLEHVVMNVTENLAYSQVFVRIGMLWKYNDQLGSVISEMMKDFDDRRYESREEKKAFLTYNARSKMFVKLLSVFVGVTAPLYFFTPFLSSLSKGQPRVEVGNITEIFYELPYHFHVFYRIEDTRTYFLTYLFEMPFVYTAGFGQTAADCLMVTLVFHISGQMSVLAVRINNIDVDPYNCKRNVRKVIEAHVRLLWMSKKVAKAFNATLLAHLLGAMTLICVLGYQILTNFANGDKTNLLSFLIFELSVLLVLYAHSTVGESLLTESVKVSEAFYACQWYDMSVENSRSILLCMMRSQRPLCLLAGKFSIFCLSTLTQVLKASMSYLSVLRSFL